MPAEDPPVPEPIQSMIDQSLRLFEAIFDDHDAVLFRPIETYKERGKKKSRILYKATCYQYPSDFIHLQPVFVRMWKVAERERANIFFGVCPRFERFKGYDLAWQIRTVRCLWADLDDCLPDEARERCITAGLPEPSAVVCSGNGTHLYWKLAEPYLIDDVAEPPEVRKDWREIKGKDRPLHFFVDELGETCYLDDPNTGKAICRNVPKLSDKALYLQDVLKGIASKIGGDHTTDLCRLLRLPGSLNRKNERNGEQPKQCILVECSGIPYPLSQFEQFALQSPDKQRRESIANVVLPTVREKLSPTIEDKLNDKISTCDLAEDRSAADFALCCFAIEKGVDRDELWYRVQGVGKFAERGENYFAQTWDKAAGKVREQQYARSLNLAGSKPWSVNGKSKRDGNNGSADTLNGDHASESSSRSGPSDDATSTDTGDEDDDVPFEEAVDDPHRLAGVVMERYPSLKKYRGEYFKWACPAYVRLAESDLKASITRIIKEEFDRDAEERAAKKEDNRGENSSDSDEDESPIQPKKVTKSLVANTLQAIDSLANVGWRTELPIWWMVEPPFDPKESLITTSEIVHIPSAANGEQHSINPTADFFSTNAVDYAFDPEQTCPQFLAFLEQLWPEDATSRQTLQEMFGYLLLPDTSQQKIFMLIGPRRSGKGTLGRVIRQLVGPENVAAPTLGSLQGDFGLQPLLNKTVALVGDARLSGRSDIPVIVERLLSISGEDPQTVNRKHMEQITTQLRARFVLLSNELPKLQDASATLPSRLVLLRLQNSFYGKEDKGLTEKLVAELPGILNWAIVGWKRLQERGYFEQPESGKELLERMDDIASPMKQFVEECCELGAGFEVSVDALYTTWKKWCDPNGVKVGSKQSMGRDVAAAIPSASIKRVREGERRERIYCGIRLRA